MGSYNRKIEGQSQRRDVIAEAEQRDLKDATLLALKMKEEAMVQIINRSLGVGKGKKIDTLLECPEGMILQTSNFSPLRPALYF